ncbi:MAG: PD40 domain-containing protein [Sporocytophaga sp.]|uniref:OmpA family protein n=1 Tax=Sporocytophaga sp. TaxID=2231183 RepID=UPI001B1223BD|nr:OmpA family protein [Sporocytophaga sp.]MBO9699184.1 PD40 domain-containing protein [Sporocytophaga sp.]
MRKLYLLFLFLLCSFVGIAQPNIKKSLKKANYYYDEHKYKEAIAAYLEVLDLEKSNAEANFKLGVSYLNTIHHTKSLPYLTKAYEVNPDIDPKILQLLGKSYQYNHRFEEALKYFQDYKVKIDKKDLEEIKKTDRKIFECENGAVYVKHPVKAKIENMGPVINTKFIDHGPVISADESVLVFTSRREGGTGEALDEQGLLFEDIYISYNKNGQWTAPQNIGKPINTEVHDASIAISPDGSQIFIYRDSDDSKGDIFLSTLQEGKWSKPQDLGKNVNTKADEKSISMTADGNTIYFTSDREGGLGGLDIYMSKKDKKGKWGVAVNLGKSINTEYDDDAPFIHPDGKTLYFSSKGHAGMGWYDIYKSTLKTDGTWSTPENLGYPINTADDDIYFVLSADNKHGYYASEREGGQGETDVYMISMPKPEELAEVSGKSVNETKEPGKKKLVSIAKVEAFNPITILKGTVTDALTKAPLESKLLIIDNEKNEVIHEVTTNSLTGGYLVILPSGKNYGIAVEKKDYLFHSENFDIPASTNYQEIVKDVELKKVAVGTKIVLRNIFFDFDKATLRPASTAELERLYDLLVQVPTLKIEISGHTDNKGSADYNKNLSQKRAQAVVDYLIKKGIDPARLKYAGYGFDRPMETNDTEEGRQLNRRTEFEIIGN